MGKKARIVSLKKPELSFEVGRKEMLIGRADDCDICLSEQHISRRQAKVYLANDSYVIENIGKNPLFINGKITEKKHLRNGDIFSFGDREFVFQVEEDETEITGQFAKTPDQLFEEKTIVISSPVHKDPVPRIVLIFPDGLSKKYDINKDIFFIGRSPEAEISIDDTTISRKHCVIKKGKEGYIIENLSETNPLFFQNKPVKKRRLVSGDQMKMGSYVFSFISDRPEDVRAATDAGIKVKGIHLSVWFASASLLVVLISSILYFQVYGPWRARKVLKTVSTYTKEGNYQKAYEMLTKLLENNLPKKESQKARESLNQVTLFIAEELESEEKLTEANELLVAYLSRYGLDAGASNAWDLLDRCHLKLGMRLEETGNYTEALKEFSAIRKESTYFDVASQEISRLWLINQQQHFKEQTVSQLLKEAENHFKNQRYLTPVNSNAYAAYQAVLSIEPGNSIAGRQIEKIKNFYRDEGEKYFQQGDAANALSSFEKFMLIDPNNSTVKERVVECRQKQIAMNKPEKEKDVRKEEIKRLLEETGAESSWVMQYLFQEEEKKEGGAP